MGALRLDHERALGDLRSQNDLLTEDGLRSRDRMAILEAEKATLEAEKSKMTRTNNRTYTRFGYRYFKNAMRQLCLRNSHLNTYGVFPNKFFSKIPSGISTRR